jgi:hypothetical protein
MNRNLGPKALACLRIAALPIGDARADLYARACVEYSHKAVHAKFEQLVGEGLMDCGVTPRSGWLTDEGRAALEAQS